jgi:folate-binding protein YgfZ
MQARGSGTRRQRPLLFDWSWRARTQVQGADARQWLNGMITANVRDLTPGHGVGSYALNPKGQILGILDVLCQADDRFLLLTDQDQREQLTAHLDHFIIMEDVALEDESESFGSLALLGAGSEGAVAAMALEAPARAGSFSSGATAAGQVLIYRQQVGGEALFEMLAPREAMTTLWEQALKAGAVAAGADEFESVRIAAGVPRFGSDIEGRELPQETGQMHLLSFTKGCYVGQEIVERIRSRGRVHRQLVALRFEGKVAAGATILAGGAEVGTVTSAAERDGGTAALGYVRYDHSSEGARVQANNQNGIVGADARCE